MANGNFNPKLYHLLSELSEEEIIDFVVSINSTSKPEIEYEFLQRLEKAIFQQLSQYITQYIISVDVEDLPTLSINGKGLFFSTQAGFLFVGNAENWDLRIGFWIPHHYIYRTEQIRFQSNINNNLTEINSVLKTISEKYLLEFSYSTSQSNYTFNNINNSLTKINSLLELAYSTSQGNHTLNQELTMEQRITDSQNKKGFMRGIAVTAKINLSETNNKYFNFFELSKDIVSIFKKLFPLVLLAKYDDPMPVIHEYLSVTGLMYPIFRCSQETNIAETQLTQWIRGIDRKKQAIFQGSPGTGKTFLAQKLAQHLIAGGDGFWEIIQFHPAYTYEDFIQGIRPQSEDGKLTYPVIPGRFLEFCQKAALCQNTCVLIIDEINRANLSQVFGELMYLLEYRDAKIPLAGSRELFSIPENVRIIGTMNTADHSIALVDHALRRRFAFITLSPNYEILRQYYNEQIEEYFPVEELIEILEEVNQEINDPHYQVGVSFFLRENIDEEIQDIWQMEIEPYLEEYFFAQPEKVDEFRWDKIQHRMS
ncbi:MAG: AAA family ATPase [Trichodesmium sp. MO_231.B1]|nr:AAA family ATPase [Trichodesmium sp. MO_231.B1]